MSENLFSSRLKEAMKNNNITLTKLSNKSNISKPLISNYLSGNYKAKQENVYTLSEILQVDPAWLMGLDVTLNENKKTKTYTILNDKKVKIEVELKDGYNLTPNMIDTIYDKLNKINKEE